jgi:MFS transporter, UMF1 family
VLVFVKEEAGERSAAMRDIVRAAVRQLARTFQEVRTLPHIWLFLLAYWLYIDGVNTFILMAANLGISIGLKSDSLMVSLLIVQLVAFPASLAFGYLGERIGTRKSILIGIGIYIAITVFAPFWVHSEMQYRLVAIFAALPLGCLQALSCSYFARLVPADRSAEFFGFYNFMGKFAAILGPAMVAGVALAVTSAGHSPALAARLGFLSITVLFLTGGILLIRAGKAPGAPGK